MSNDYVPYKYIPEGWACEICGADWLTEAPGPLKWDFTFGLCHCVLCGAPYTYRSEESPGVPYCRVRDEWLDACKLYWKKYGKDVGEAPMGKLHDLRKEIVGF